MRYMQCADVIFTDDQGNSYTIKEERLIPMYEKKGSVSVNEQSCIDEIASRQEIYGEWAEDQSYKIFEMNVLKLTETDFSMSTVKSLDIPR